jgi:hypothetical protein
MSCDEISQKRFCNDGPCRVSIDRNLSNLQLAKRQNSIPVYHISLSEILSFIASRRRRRDRPKGSAFCLLTTEDREADKSCICQEICTQLKSANVRPGIARSSRFSVPASGKRCGGLLFFVKRVVVEASGVWGPGIMGNWRFTDRFGRALHCYIWEYRGTDKCSATSPPRDPAVARVE